MCWLGLDGVSSSGLAPANRLFNLILSDLETFLAFNLSVLGSSASV
jgi:hypothetical protein